MTAAERIDDLLREPQGISPEAEIRIEQAWREILRTREGRRMCWDILSVCHFGMSAFAADTNLTMHITGKQSVGEHVMQMINRTAPDAYNLMIKEIKEDEQYDRDQRSKRQQHGTGGTGQ